MQATGTFTLSRKNWVCDPVQIFFPNHANRIQKPMNKSVVIIGPAHPLRGGLASYDERLAREFISQGCNASIYTFSLQYPGFLFPGTTQYSTEAAPPDIP